MIEFVCDKKRHLVCLPYSIENLHTMARGLGIGRRWFHRDHYDIPVRDIVRVTALCRVVSSKEIVKIVGRRR